MTAAWLIGLVCFSQLPIKGPESSPAGEARNETAANLDGPVIGIHFFPDDQALLVARTSRLELRSMGSNAQRQVLPVEVPQITSLVMSPKGDRFAVIGGRAGEFGRCEVWDAGNLTRLNSWQFDGDWIATGCWSADGKSLALAGPEKHVTLIQVESGTQQMEPIPLTPHAGIATAVQFSGGNLLASGGSDATILLHDLKTRRVVRTLRNHLKGVVGLAIQPGHAETSKTNDARPKSEPPQLGDRTLLASIGDDSTLRFWDVKRGRLVRFARLESRPLSLTWMPDGSRILVSSIDGQVREIDVVTLETKRNWPILEGWVYCVAVDSQGTRFVAGGEADDVVVSPLAEE